MVWCLGGWYLLVCVGGGELECLVECILLCGDDFFVEWYE